MSIPGVTSETWQHDVCPLISPFEITTNQTAAIQQKTPILTYEHV